MKALIVEDEQQSKELLEGLLDRFCSDIEVIGWADSVPTAVEMIENLQPEIVFLDIDIKEGKGFDVLKAIPNRDFHVVFTTGHDDYAIKAFRFSATDYLLKPIAPSDLRDAVSKILEMKRPEADTTSALLGNLGQDTYETKKLVLSSLDGYDILDVKNIIYCKSDKSYTDIHTDNGKKYTVTKTIKEYDELLSDYQFMRVHQSYLVNINFISRMSKSDGGFLHLKDGSEIPVATRRRDFVLTKLKSL